MPLYFPFQSNDATVSYSDCILPETTFTFLYEAIDLSDYVTELNISGARGQGVVGSVTIKDRTNFVADLISSYSPANSIIRAHNMTDVRTVSVTLVQGSNSITYPNLIPGDPSWDNEGTLTWEFSDYTPIINLDNQNVGDYLFSEGDDVTSHNVIDDVETACGEVITPDFTAYEIGTFRANEANILGVIDEIASPVQGYRKWIGSTLHIEVLDSLTPVMQIIDRYHIPEGGLTYGYDTSNVKTYFKFFRDKPLASYLGEAQCTGLLGTESPCVGRVVEITFNRPTLHAIITHTETNGSIEDGVFYDAANAPITQPGGWFNFYGTIGNEAVKWIGTYVPNFVLGTDMYIPSWKVRATGGSLVAEETGDFDATKVVSVVEAIYGRRPEYKNLETELLRNPADATTMLNAIETEVLWSIRRLSLNTPFLIPGREGQFVGITHLKHGLEEEPCLINGWSHSFSVSNGCNFNYDLRAETT